MIQKLPKIAKMDKSAHLLKTLQIKPKPDQNIQFELKMS